MRFDCNLFLFLFFCFIWIFRIVNDNNSMCKHACLVIISFRFSVYVFLLNLRRWPRKTKLNVAPNRCMYLWMFKQFTTNYCKSNDEIFYFSFWILPISSIIIRVGCCLCFNRSIFFLVEKKKNIFRNNDNEMREHTKTHKRAVFWNWHGMQVFVVRLSISSWCFNNYMRKGNKKQNCWIISINNIGSLFVHSSTYCVSTQ